MRMGVRGLRATLGACPLGERLRRGGFSPTLLFPSNSSVSMSHPKTQGILGPECSQMMFDPGGLSFGTAEGESEVGGSE